MRRVLRTRLSFAQIALYVLLMTTLCGRPLAAQQVRPDQPPAAQVGVTKTGAYRIAGRVVSAIDGHRLKGATVTIGAVQGGRPTQSTISGERGEFAFEGVAAGKYTLLGDMRGFESANYDQHEQFSTAIVTGVGVDTASLELRLKPTATLSGKVFDDAGEPVRQAQVLLYREDYGTGRKQIGQVAAVQTDDRGEYALGSLPEGKYFLSVQGIPWYAVHPQAIDPNLETPVLTGVDPAVDVAYATTFYGNVTDSGAATQISLKAADQMRADVQMRAIKAARIVMHFEPGTNTVSFPTLRMPVFDGFAQVTGQMQQPSPGTMEIVGLAPGRYQMEQADPNLGAASRLSTVDVTAGAVRAETSEGVVQGAVTVTLEEENAAKLPAQMQVLLRGAGPGNVEAQVLNRNGEAVFSGLRPDEYHVAVYGENRVWQIVRLEKNGNRLTNTRLPIASGEATAVKLVIAGTALSVEGLAVRNGKPEAGAMIVLVPVDTMDDDLMFRRDQSDLDGTFALPDVAAGRYIVVAIEDGWKLEWGRLDILARYLAKGVPVDIPARERRSIHLPDPITVQPR